MSEVDQETNASCLAEKTLGNCMPVYSGHCSANLC